MKCVLKDVQYTDLPVIKRVIFCDQTSSTATPKSLSDDNHRSVGSCLSECPPCLVFGNRVEESATAGLETSETRKYSPAARKNQGVTPERLRCFKKGDEASLSWKWLLFFCSVRPCTLLGPVHAWGTARRCIHSWATRSVPRTS